MQKIETDIVLGVSPFLDKSKVGKLMRDTCLCFFVEGMSVRCWAVVVSALAIADKTAAQCIAWLLQHKASASI